MQIQSVSNGIAADDFHVSCRGRVRGERGTLSSWSCLASVLGPMITRVTFVLLSRMWAYLTREKQEEDVEET